MSGSMSGMTVKKLTVSVGASISGVNLGSLSAEELAGVRRAFGEHCMLVFRGQFLTPEQQLAFAEAMGDVIPFEGLEASRGLPPGVMRLRNDGRMEKITENWHSDGPYLETAADLVVLAPHTLPSTGGDTMWSSLYKAYDGLSDGLKAMIRNLRCVCESNRLTKGYGLEKLYSAIKPIVREHPDTGRPYLFIGGPDAFVNFVGMTRDESEPLIRYLYAQAHRPDIVYRHMWQPGDVVMWDNRSTLHYAVHDYGSEPREMHRIALKAKSEAASAA